MVADRVYKEEANQSNPGAIDSINQSPPVKLMNGTPTPTPFQPDITAGNKADDNQLTTDSIFTKDEATLAPVPTQKLKIIGGGSRINILVMGLDYRDYLAGDEPRSDTMILITIDPIAKTAGMLSIPRDMWVNIPGFGFYKINGSNEE